MNPLYYNLRRGQAAAAASAAPVATITHSNLGTFVLDVRGTPGEEIICDPGNGDAPTTVVLAATSRTFQYVNDGASREVSISGALSAVTRVEINSMTVTALDLSLFAGMTVMLSGANDASDYGFISQLPSLAHLNIFSTTVPVDIAGIAASLSSLTYMSLAGSPVTYTTQTWNTRTAGTYYFDSTVTTSDEVNQWLIDLNTAGWSNCTIYIDGTNPAPTAAAAVAIAELTGRGCTVITS